LIVYNCFDSKRNLAVHIDFAFVKGKQGITGFAKGNEGDGKRMIRFFLQSPIRFD